MTALTNKNSEQKFFCILKQPSFSLIIIANNNNLTNINILQNEDVNEETYLKQKYIKKTNSILAITCNQLIEYFNNKRKVFNLPYVILQGTEFQKKVWHQLKDVNYGKVLSYENFAKLCNSSTRPTSNCLGKNPLPIILPCHRIIRKNNQLGGYKNSQEANIVNLKQQLLKLEGINL